MDRLAPSPHSLTFPDLQHALVSANERFALIQSRYPRLKAWLVIFSPAGQCDVAKGPLNWFVQFPALFFDCPHKAKLAEPVRKLRLLKQEKEEASTLEQRSRIQNQIDRVEIQIHELLRDLTADGNCRVEIRFHHLDHGLIGELQTDDLVDRELTPQTKASIRIVLGTIFRFLPGQCVAPMPQITINPSPASSP